MHDTFSMGKHFCKQKSHPSLLGASDTISLRKIEKCTTQKNMQKRQAILWSSFLSVQVNGSVRVCKFNIGHFKMHQICSSKGRSCLKQTFSKLPIHGLLQTVKGA